MQNLKEILNKKVIPIVGLLSICISIFLFLSFISYFSSGVEDFDKINTEGQNIKNIGGELGLKWSQKIIFIGFGIFSFLFIPILMLFGVKFLLKRELKIIKSSLIMIFLTIYLSTTTCFISNLISTKHSKIIYGYFGEYININLTKSIGEVGLGLIILFVFFALIIIKGTKIKIPTIKSFNVFKEKNKKEIKKESKLEEIIIKEEPKEELKWEKEITTKKEKKNKDDLDLKIEPTVKEKETKQNLEEYEPKLDLSNYKKPPIDLLEKHGDSKIKIDKKELELNKNKIVDTLKNYKIGIKSITATIGPTITLYEIVPEAGIRISKIKNLEDDIALSLSALGIRIIAPIPGKGTIGIEVPNNTASTVSIRSVISSEKFQKSEMELPFALGKNISNETFVADLTKMPHILMAGATGQGKSVGLNTILTSLLYKKHPSEVKLVLIDPKKVELNLFNKIEKHFLAKIPESEESIITDTKKVINTLNSLCIEMQSRYDLLKLAHCRNIMEYNKKFKSRKLSPQKGHKFLPYIVLVIDEFADLIMTAGKEIETPIARLAQLARAIGIHLIIATQRPSVNVITGIIKANFPARIAFRVTSKIDSRTILDTSGADQLIGRGDMLISTGNELIRLQCAFVDTPEVENLNDYISKQQGYPNIFELPEYIPETEKNTTDLKDRDSMFDEAARMVVEHQQGSTSLIQRRLKLGYNRAGRIVDQLEAAGIVGPFEGSKARKVLISDLISLEEMLNEIKKNDK